MKYTFGDRKELRMPSKWVTGLIVLTVGLLVWDYIQYGTLMNYVLFGVK